MKDNLHAQEIREIYDRSSHMVIPFSFIRVQPLRNADCQPSRFRRDYPKTQGPSLETLDNYSHISAVLIYGGLSLSFENST